MEKKYFVLLGILLLISVMISSGCNTKLDTPPAEVGNTVQVQYTGKLEDGTIFDTSVGKQPVEFTLGVGQMLPGFEQAVLGMKIGESKTVTIPSEDAYGPHHNELVEVINRGEFLEGTAPKVGQRFQMMQDDGGIRTVTVTAFSEAEVTIDANHPLAGEDLIFEIKLIGIK